MKVTQYNTTQYGKFISAEVKPAVYAGGVRTLLPAGEAQGFWGFGVAITGSSCYNLNQMEPADRRAFLQAIYGKEGLNLQVGRISIGSSDYSAELYTYADEGPNSFSIERDKEYIIPMLREILAVNPELKLLASPWSPPAWAKTGGSICGGCMRPEYVEDYAAYIVKFVEAYQAEGIPIAALTPQNEPQTDQRGQMPACTWQPDTEAKFVAALRKKLTEAGLSTEIWLYD
ncbi:MAG: glucosylceramidase, partial [Clostridia bacterium]|nr:glucosylceramidase [Clostridia bacterium]